MNKYLVAYTLKGKPERYCQKLSKTISEEFNVVDPHRRMPPHFTLKSPFEASEKQIKELKSALKNFGNSHDDRTIRLEGFGHFHKRVVYVDGLPGSQKTKNLLSQLTRKLLGIDWLELDNHDRNLDLHVTIARPQDDKQFKEMLSYLESNYNPDFQIDFNRIALLQLQEDVNEWTVINEFEF